MKRFYEETERNGVVEYLVRWKGYDDPKFDCWVPESNDVSKL